MSTSSKLKYVMYDDGRFVILPCHMSHCDVAKHNVHSAGFVQFYSEGEDIKAYCFGESFTLKKECDKDFDEARINVALRMV